MARSTWISSRCPVPASSAADAETAPQRRPAPHGPRLRLDAALYEPVPPRQPGAQGRPRKKGNRLPNLAQVLVDASTHWPSITVSNWYGTPERCLEICSQTAVPVRWVLLRGPLGQFEPQALLCSDPMKDPLCVIGWFVQRWPVEVTSREVRDHLGFESQRQWSDPAIARTTPCLLGLFSLVALFANQLAPPSRYAVWIAAWYRKQQPTFADTLAAVRREICKAQGLSISRNWLRVLAGADSGTVNIAVSIWRWSLVVPTIVLIVPWPRGFEHCARERKHGFAVSGWTLNNRD